MKELLTSIPSEKSLNPNQFWANFLNGALFSEIPRDVISEEEPFKTEQYLVELPNEITTRIHDLNTITDFDIEDVLLTVHCKIVSVLSGNTDITTGYYNALGDAKSLKTTLPLRIDFKAGKWADLIKTVEGIKSEIHQHSGNPLEQIKKDINSNGKIFETAFQFLNQTIDNEIVPLEVHDLCFLTQWSFPDSDEKSALIINYDSSSLSKDYIKRIAGYYMSALELILSDISVSHESQCILSQEEKQILLEGFNDNTVVYPAQKTFVQLFEEQAYQRPNAVAVQFENIEWTYGELNNRANLLAHQLIKEKLKIEDAVVVIMDRTADWMVTVLGILKAGGVYVPVRPDWPESRKRIVIKKTDAKFVITDSKNEAENIKMLAADKSQLKLCNIEAIINKDGKEDNPVVGLTPDNLSYIIFTSGSTGEPKGAMIEHKGMLNHLYSKVNDLELVATDIVAQNSSQSFDISVWQLISGLLVGAKTVIYSDEHILNVNGFLKAIKNDHITILELVPSYLEVLLNPGNRQNIAFEAIRYLLITGEPLKIGLVTEWFRYFKDIPLVNAYGPTEASDDITHHFMFDVPNDKLVPVGKTIQNLNIYVVDSFGQLAPIGTKGDVLVSGVGVGRGYIGDKEKTNAVFSTDYLKPEEQLKLYRTGDIGSWTPEGILHLFGRKDDQIKLNGYRIDIGEIEQCISKQPSITGNATILKDKALHAFLVLDVESENTHKILANCKAGLSEGLPYYMIPQYFHILDNLPTTPNGKIDRKALFEINPETKTKPFHPPTNEVEMILEDIWKSNLGLERVDIYDDFFELGGHSAIALKILGLVEQKLGKRLPMTSFLENRSIAQLARLVSDTKTKQQWNCVVPLKPEGTKTPLYIVHGGNHNVLTFKGLAENMDKDQPVFGIQAKGLDGKVAPDDNVNDIAKGYIEEVKVLNPNGPYALSGFCFGGMIAYEMARLLRAEGKEVTLVAMFDCVIEPHLHQSNFTLKKIMAKTYRLVHLVYIGLRMFTSWKNFKERIGLEIKRFKKLLSKSKKQPKDTSTNVFQSSPEVDRAHELAELKYQISPQDIVIDIFKPLDSVQFVHEPDFFGWKRVGVKGIRKHTIRGNQASMFVSPNVEGFSEKLQFALDNYDADNHQESKV